MGGFKEMSIEEPKGYLEHYLGYFGERELVTVDLTPTPGSDKYYKAHIEVVDAGMIPGKDPEDLTTYLHPCWCNPELIYADDRRGNKVWLHKRVN